MSHKIKLITMLVVMALLFSACNLPSAGQPAPATEEEPDAVFTAAAQTVEAKLTESASVNPPTVPVLPSATQPGPTTAPPTNTVPASTATQSCDKADFVADITVPDGTQFNPGETFTKTWRLKNVGTCSWTTSYAVVFHSGEKMDGPTTQALTGNVNPGETIDISVDLKAPASDGTYTGHWRLRNGAGVLFAKFYVTIKVGATSSGFDLHSKAPLAEWISGGGGGAGTPLTFGGPDNDPNGFAMYRNGEKVEGGSTPSKILEMHPKWVDDGVISGLYPPYKVVAGEHFKATIGFLTFPDGTCGAGNAKFQLNYKEGGTLTPLGSWTESCDGSLKNIDVDLSSIAGKTVQFALAVIANGPSAQDWAVWINPRVEIP
ncbi:MAG: hypothetical protein Kow002_15730 [Anaerolineales bacterium]